MPSPSQNIECTLVVFSITGNNVLGFANEEDVRNQINAVVVQTEAKHVILDLREIEYLQSAGFVPLLSLRRLIQQHRQGRVILCHLQRDVHEVLLLTKMINEAGDDTAPFEAQPDVPSAVEALRPDLEKASYV